MNATRLHYLTPIYECGQKMQVQIVHRTVSQASEQRRIEKLESAIRQAAEWLRQGASGRALEVLEDSM